MTDNTYSRKEIVDFWTKDKPRVIGDIVGRPEAIRLLGDITNKRILEAGCGTGYVARLLADRGAKVVGIDNSQSMLNEANFSENMNHRNIIYDLCDITEMHKSFIASRFDRIISTGVLVHNDMDANSAFLKGSYEILKPEGILVVSVTHPSLFLPTSPARSGKPSWVRYTPLENKPYNESQRFTEHYMDVDKNMIHTELWHHTIESYLNAAADSGLTLIKVNEPLLKEEHLLIPEWGTDYDYPAFFQIVLKKVK